LPLFSSSCHVGSPLDIHIVKIGVDIGWKRKGYHCEKHGSFLHNLLARLVWTSWEWSTTGDLPTAAEETSQGRLLLDLSLVGGKRANAHGR